MSTAAAVPLTIAHLTLPDGFEGNPWQWLAKMIKAQMYPSFGPHFLDRVKVLLCLLSVAILVAFLYLFMTIRDIKARRKQIWFARVVSRPQGRYIIVNQYLGYPVCFSILMLVWIGWVVYLYFMFYKTTVTPQLLFLYQPLTYIPLFVHLSTTTSTTLSGANLASRRAPTSDRHRLSPLAANSLYFGFVPLFVICIGVTGGINAAAWRTFAQHWEVLYETLQSAAREWDGTLSQSTIDTVNYLSDQRIASADDWRRAVQGCTVVYCLFAFLLIILNFIGGIYLVYTLRSLDSCTSYVVPVPANTPLVAPLRLILTEDRKLSESPLTSDSEKGATNCSTLPSHGVPETTTLPTAPWEANDFSTSSYFGASTRLKRLEWDVMLFFVSVVPSCLVFMGFSIWFALQCYEILLNPARFEFLLTGFVWMYTLWGTLAMAAITLKTICSSRRHAARANHKGLLITSGKGLAVGISRTSLRHNYTTVDVPIDGLGPLAGTEDERKVVENWQRRREQSLSILKGVHVDVAVEHQVA
ncbi:BQ5605_C033g11226 [Microbotryum silenes-dioicae]|uniref:BQ5605_C033g11226 protein n=1 Tax=Microbotryum silenes-dioicae TaxID=796604 RepID=A0A2X0MJS2_9BASI|nr:BQ5605_C033g11226 [Microbotryum silenes-dioicae]